MKHEKDIKNIKSLENAKNTFFAFLVLASILLALFFDQRFLFVLSGSVAMLRGYFKRRKQLAEYSKCQSSAGFVELKEEGFVYSEGKSAYKVEIGYRDIRDVSVQSVWGFSRIHVKLSGQRSISMLNFVDSNKLYNALRQHVTNTLNQVATTNSGGKDSQ